MFDIQQHVPIPQGTGLRNEYPFMSMNIGDSFELSSDEARKVRTAAQHCKRRRGRHFTVRDQGNGLHRCWRTA